MRKFLPPHVAVLGLFGLLSIGLTWPLVAQMSTHLAGDDVDVLINPWADWWTRKALSEGLDFYYTDYMFYPQGTSLVFHSFSHVHTVTTLLLAPLLGHFAAYNLTLLLAYTLSGFGTYLLARYLLDSVPAAFVAGLVFAFSPYHLFQGSHPVLVTTQFIPLCILAFWRVLHEGGLSPARRLGQVVLASVWFLLTALSSWHLMILLAGWMGTYGLYTVILDRDRLVPGTIRYLATFVLLSGLLVLPFVWPILHEYLAGEAAYMAVEVQQGRGNDLLSFFTPHRLHPVFGPLVLEINARIGYGRNWPAYLGYLALGLVVPGALAGRRQARFWWLSGLVFFLLSLGARIRWCGEPLHSFDLPWATPIIGVLRHPHRLTILLFLSLAVLAGYGVRWLFERIAKRSRTLGYGTLVLLTVLLLFEYWAFPFPTTRPSYSPFLHQLAQEEGDFAVADFPMGRQEAKYYLFFQTIHGKKLVDGVVSRTPHDAYAFVDGDPLLGPLRNENVPTDHLQERMAVLAAQDVRYIMVHKRFFDARRMALWQRWLDAFPPPVYEDDQIIAYSTVPALNTHLLREEGVVSTGARLGDHVRLRGYRLSSSAPAAVDGLTVTLLWQSDGRVDRSYHVFVHLLDGNEHLIAQHDGVPVRGERPTWSWWDGEIVPDVHTVPLPQDLPGGTILLSVGMYHPATGNRLPVFSSSGKRLADDRFVLGQVQVETP